MKIVDLSRTEFRFYCPVCGCRILQAHSYDPGPTTIVEAGSVDHHDDGTHSWKLSGETVGAP